MKGTWHFSAKDRDDSVRPQDDFYHYANGGWLKRVPIPKTETRWGPFVQLRFLSDKRVKTIIDELLEQKRVKNGSPDQMIRDFYRSGLDMKKRNALGARPIEPFLKRISSLSNVTDLQDMIADLHRIGVGPLFGAGIDQDSKDTTKYILHFFQDGLGLPDRDYYFDTDTESTRVRDAYVPHVEAMFRLLKNTKEEAGAKAKTVMRIETLLAKEHMNKVDRREIEKTYHKLTTSKLQKLSPAIDWKRYLARVSAGSANTFIVMQPAYISSLSRFLTETPLSDWKVYLEWTVLNDFAGMLSVPFVRQNFAFYGTTLTGTKHMKPLWRRALSATNGSLGELIGRIYVKKYFSAYAKKKMNELVDDLFAVYRERIQELDWMNPATKKKALVKLSAMNRKIGYPDKWKSYAGLKIVPDDFVGNALRANEFEHRRQMKKLHGPIDRTEWFMYPQTVNAYNAPNMNEIAFPAGILQPPLFEPDGDDAINYGAMGMTIAHEISHGFDDEGSKFDEKGNLKNWWTADDKKRFAKKSALLVRQYNGYEVMDGVRVNGKLTLGENIADLGGTAVAYAAYKRALERKPSGVRRGFTPEQRFFFGVALFERENVRPEFEKMATLTDPHSPGVFRINGVFSNLPEFYEAFGVKKGDKMYRAPKDRTKIW